MTEEYLKEQLSRIRPLDEHAMELSRQRWSHVAKPLKSLGLLEDAVTIMAGCLGDADVDITKKALVILCADNGVVEEGVTQTGQEVTGIVTRNFTTGLSCACLMAGKAGMDVFPVDVGVVSDLDGLGTVHPLTVKKVRRGTANLSRGPAMTREETCQALLVGIEMAETLKSGGYGLLAAGEMGIGNTTTSSAVAAVLLGEEPRSMTGRGAGLDDAGLMRKVEAIRRGIAVNRPDRKDGIDVLSKVGGLDLAALAGLYLGAAIHRLPVVLDGFISAAAALAAAAIHPTSLDYLLASHVSSEPAGQLLLDKLGKRPVIHANMCLGEGTGAVAAVSLFDMAADIYKNMGTFQDIRVEEYRPL